MLCACIIQNSLLATARDVSCDFFQQKVADLGELGGARTCIKGEVAELRGARTFTFLGVATFDQARMLHVAHAPQMSKTFSHDYESVVVVVVIV